MVYPTDKQTNILILLIYRNASNKRPGRLLNFQLFFGGGVYSRGAFKKGGGEVYITKLKFFCDDNDFL